jgi:uracil-DNA glycosylase
MTINSALDSLQRSRTMLRQKLESLQRSGVQQLAKPPQTSAPLVQEVPIEAKLPTERPGAAQPPRAASATAVLVRPTKAAESQPVSAGVTASPPPVARPMPPDTAVPLTAEERRLALTALRKQVALCRRCAELAARRTHTVFGAGNPQPRLCFLGEAPGADEDRQGEPFVGAAGQLLTKILAACSLTRDDVFILNVLKCRPPGNRNPLPDEVANCRMFFERQLEILQPEFICCLGAVAAQTLLRSTRPVGQLRGKFHDYRGSRVVVTYHPSYLLRTPAMKRHTWEDMKMLMQAMGIPIPKT